MIGVKGVPFTASFEWARWSNSARDLRAQGCDGNLDRRRSFASWSSGEGREGICSRAGQI